MMNTELSQISAFFCTDKAIGLIQFSEPKRLAFINSETKKWVADDSDFKSQVEMTLDELNAGGNPQIALNKIKMEVIQELTHYYNEKITFFKDFLNQLNSKLILELSGDKLGKVEEYYDDLANITRSKGLELSEFNEQLSQLSSLFSLMTDLVIVKRTAMKYIKELVRLLKGTKIEKESGNIKDNNVRIEIAKENMAKLLDGAKIMDFKNCSEVINLQHIINAIHAKEYNSAQEVINAFGSSVD
jgi:hypothetical protein